SLGQLAADRDHHHQTALLHFRRLLRSRLHAAALHRMASMEPGASRHRMDAPGLLCELRQHGAGQDLSSLRRSHSYLHRACRRTAFAQERPVMIELQSVSKTYRLKGIRKQVFDSFTFTFPPNKNVAV